MPLDIFTVPAGLEVTVWAQSPQLRNPTNIDIDAQGRVWVTEGVNYRRHKDRDAKGDRVVVLEDTDHDGRADTSSVFVQEPTLVAPLGIAVLDNRIIVSNAPDLIVYTDVNRDRKFDPAVDRREVLLSGFDGRNHDHALHSVTFGPDGRWYFSNGNAGAFFTDRGGRTFRIGSAYNPVPDGGAQPVFGYSPPTYAGARSDDGHVYVGGFSARMQPDGTGVEILGFNFRNSYEQTVTSFGDIFHNDNDDPPACRTSFLMEYGNFGFFSRDGKRYWQADRRPGQSIPTAEWRQEDPGRDSRGRCVRRWRTHRHRLQRRRRTGREVPRVVAVRRGRAQHDFRIFPQARRRRIPAGAVRLSHQQQGAGLRRHGFQGWQGQRRDPDVLPPSDVAVGPDGAIYVADWFDPRVGGHDDKDDTTSGAIYRIAPKGFVPRVPAFDAATVEGQLMALRSTAVNVRALGFDGLAARGPAALAPVQSLLDDGNPYVRARAVWLLTRLGADGLARVEGLLGSPDANLRVAAYRALRQAGTAQRHAARLARDPSPAVRREVALSQRDVPFEAAREVLLTLAQGYDGNDRSLLEAWGTGATHKEEALYAALAAKAPGADAAKWPRAYADLVWRLTPRAAVPAFAARAQSGSLPVSERTRAITALGFIPTREAAFALLDVAQGGGKDLRDNPALWWLLNYKDSRWADAGIDAELKRRGLFDPATVTVNDITVPAPAATSTLPTVADIAKLRGNAKQGASAAVACRMCHRVGGEGADYGPALDGFASRQTRETVIVAIVNPSNDIAHGYEGTEVTLLDGRKLHGLILSGGDPLIIQSTGGVTQLIPASMVKERKRLGRSLMMSAEQLGLSAQQVADITAYLR